MHLNISRGPMATGKTIRLRQTARDAGLTESQILIGTSFAEKELETLVIQRGLRGAKVICIDNCREEQLAYLERVKDRLCDSLTVHVVVTN